ncbi:MAG: S-layer homology domain-containing protein [Clostridiaceae bacterium]|nr:S-layer homology domain-containing protein [Clostridiaceae bacterium]
MKRCVSSALCALLFLLTVTSSVLAAGYQTKTLEKGVLGTLNSSGASYEATMTIPGYIGQLELEAHINGEDKHISVSVVKPKENAEVSVSIKKFDGYIYQASLTAERYAYNLGSGFTTAADRFAVGSSSAVDGSLSMPGSGLYSGRVDFYYSKDDIGYKSIDNIPDDKWGGMFWFSLGSDYILALSDNDISEFLETGELWGYNWPGLRMLLAGEDDKPVYVSGSFGNFKQLNRYNSSVFSDVSDQWYSKYAQKAYEYNLMKGNEDGTFYANGSMTVAEAVTIAARLHNIYYGKTGEFLQGERWYDIYVGYALERGIITSGEFDSYERAITRKEMASLLGKAVELSNLEKINDFTSIPDVSSQDKSFEAILALYNSGVLTGSKEDGSFLPSDSVIRSEVSAMVSRLISPELRVHKSV